MDQRGSSHIIVCETMSSMLMTKLRSDIDPYLDVARWVGRTQSPFISFYSVLFYGIKEENQSENSDDDNDNSEYVITSCATSNMTVTLFL